MLPSDASPRPLCSPPSGLCCLSSGLYGGTQAARCLAGAATQWDLAALRWPSTRWPLAAPPHYTRARLTVASTHVASRGAHVPHAVALLPTRWPAAHAVAWLPTRWPGCPRGSLAAHVVAYRAPDAGSCTVCTTSGTVDSCKCHSCVPRARGDTQPSIRGAALARWGNVNATGLPIALAWQACAMELSYRPSTRRNNARVELLLFDDEQLQDDRQPYGQPYLLMCS